MRTLTHGPITKRWLTPFCLLSLGLASAACGGSDDGSKDNQPAAESQENPFVVDETVEGVAQDILAATDGMTPSDATVVYNLVWDAPFFQTIRQGFQVAAQEIGFSADIVTIEPPEWPPTGSLPDYTAANADAYISHWAGGVYVDNPTVPWFAIEPGTDVEPDLYMAGVTSDNDGIGQLLSDLMLEVLDGNTGKVAVYGAGDGPGYARGTSVQAILEDAGLTVVGSPGDARADDATKVLEAMSADFEENSDIVGVVGTLGFHGGAIGSWLEDNGFGPGEIAVVSTDFETETQEMITSGYISATTVQRQYWWGYLAGHVAYGAAMLDADELNSILKPYSDGDHVVTTKFDTVTPANSEQYLDFLSDIGVLE